MVANVLMLMEKEGGGVTGGREGDLNMLWLGC